MIPYINMLTFGKISKILEQFFKTEIEIGERLKPFGKLFTIYVARSPLASPIGKQGPLLLFLGRAAMLFILRNSSSSRMLLRWRFVWRRVGFCFRSALAASDVHPLP